VPEISFSDFPEDAKRDATYEWDKTREATVKSRDANIIARETTHDC